MTTRKEGDRYLTRVEIDICSEGQSVPDVIKELQEAAEGLENPIVEGWGWVDNDRDQEAHGIEVKGDRPATEIEIERFEIKEAKRIEQEAKQARERVDKERRGRERDDQAALQRAQKAFPAMFKPEALEGGDE